MACFLCMRPSLDRLCRRHATIYTYDSKYSWFRKKKRLEPTARAREDRRKYRKNETKLIEIMNHIYERGEVFFGVHPIWAVSPKGALLEYDIAVISEKTFIEYNGIQHYEYPNFFHKSRKEFLQQQQRDRLKKELAEKNGWKLVIVKYDTHVDYGTIYELMKS